MNCDPDSRDRRGTTHILKALIADYLKGGGADAVAARLGGKTSAGRRFDRQTWLAISPRHGSGLQLQIGIQTSGCLHFRKDFVGCLNCGIPAAAAGRPVTSEEIVAQIDHALEATAGTLDGVSRVCIQGDGSFLSLAEVPAAAVYAVTERLSQLPRLHTIMMETRLDLVERNLPHILRVRSLLMPERRLEVALGLESSSEFVRNVIFRKGTSRKCDVERILRTLADSDIDILLYVFIKPALLTEAEAIYDAVRTVLDVHSLAARAPHVHWTAALQPSFVQPQTFLAWLYGRGAFVPPSLWSVAEIVRRSAGGPASVHVGSPEDYPPPIATAANQTHEGSVCGCTPAFYGTLLEYNKHGSVERLIAELPECACRSLWADRVNITDLSAALARLRRAEPLRSQLGDYEDVTNIRGDGRSPAFV